MNKKIKRIKKRTYMSFKNNAQIIAFTFLSKKKREYIGTAVIRWDYDPNWGADADGNRGMSVTSIDTIEILTIQSTITDNLIHIKYLSNNTYHTICEMIEENALEGKYAKRLKN